VEELEEGTPNAVMAQTGMKKKKNICSACIEHSSSVINFFG
jgi:hypothetical protein